MNDSLQRALVSVRVKANIDERVTVFARAHKAVFGKGWSFDREEKELTGAESLLGLLAADVMGLFRRLLRHQRLRVDHLEATASAELTDPLAHLGVIGATGEPHYTAFFLKAFIESPEPAEAVRTVWAEALRRAPLANTLQRAGDIHFELQIA